MYTSIDVGGTNTRVATAYELDNPIFSGEPIRRKNTHIFNNDIGFIIDAALELADGKLIKAVGVGTPGMPNKAKTRIASAKNLPNWVDEPLVDSLSEGLNCPVYYDNDVTAAVLGEAYYGHTVGKFDYVIWGTGVGGGAVSYEQLKPTVSIPNWREHFAEWENDCGGAELAKAYGKPPELFTSDDWHEIAAKFELHLKTYIENRKPKAIVFGGGLAIKHAQMLLDMGEDMNVEIAVTEFGDDSGLYGGFGLIKNGLEN